MKGTSEAAVRVLDREIGQMHRRADGLSEQQHERKIDDQRSEARSEARSSRAVHFAI